MEAKWLFDSLFMIRMMCRRLLYSVVLLWVVSVFVTAQNVGIGIANPHPYARLEVWDTMRGVLIPRLTKTQRDLYLGNPPEGLIIYNLTCHVLQYYNGSKWVSATRTDSCCTCGDTLVGWRWFIPVVITNNTGLGYSQVVVRMTINTQALISSGKMQSDARDLRFVTDLLSCGELCYWVDLSTVNTTSTVVWVRLDTIPPLSSDTIYMLYGNPGATSAADGTCTFDFFDDFTTNPDVSGNWTIFRRANDPASECKWDGVSSVYLTTAVNGRGCAAFANITVAGGFEGWAFEVRYRAGGGTGADGWALAFDKNIQPYSTWGSPSAGGSIALSAFDGNGLVLSEGYAIEFDNWLNNADPSANHIAIIKETNACWDVSANACTHLAFVNTGVTEDNVWHLTTVKIVPGGDIKVSVDGTVMLSGLNLYTPMGFGRFALTAATGGANNNHQIDYIAAYRFAPVTVSLGTEGSLCE